MKPAPFLISLCLFILSCKKDSKTTTGTEPVIQSPKAGSTWSYKYKVANTNSTKIDSATFNWIARDTMLDNTNWLAIYKKLSTQTTWTPFFAIRSTGFGWNVYNLTASGSKGLWLPVGIEQGAVYTMYNPIGADYGFSNTGNGKQMQVISASYLLTEPGVSYDQLVYAGSTVNTSSGNISESIYYSRGGALMIQHVLNIYTSANDNHNIITWSLLSYKN